MLWAHVIPFWKPIDKPNINLVMVLCHDMASKVALVMAPLLPWIRRGVGNMGLKVGGGFKGGK